MPTTLPISHQRARAAVCANKSRAARIVALRYQAWDELKQAVNTDDFKAIAAFSALGLLVGVLAMIFGVQAAWM